MAAAPKPMPICYLCGLPISAGQMSMDHCPPKQFHPVALRSTTPDLLTLPSHKACNKAYEKDEEYFVSCLGILAKDTCAGEALTWDIARRSKHEAGQRLGQRILSHFNETPGGIQLPAGMIALEYEADRIGRVIWKITRGLYYNETAIYLPETTQCKIQVVVRGEDPPEEFQLVRDTPSKGRHPNVFDYKNFIHPNLPDFNYWAMSLWSEIIVIVGFHSPGCSCEKCSTSAV